MSGILNEFDANENEYARVAQWWSIALPRRGPRVRIPSRAFLLYPDKEQVKRPVLLFGVFVFGGSAWIS